jgi:endonuclease I
MMHRSNAVGVGLLAGLAGVTASVNSVCAQIDPWAAPASYYNSVGGTGAALRTSLTSAMSAGHIQRAYGDFRFSAVIHDADPNASGQILLAYNNASVLAAWDSGATWNREHVWPESRQPGTVSNSTRGNLGDPHALRPCDPGINSSRGNKPFGTATTTGGHGSLGTFYFPGDMDKGDIARSLFYSETRWGPTLGITLVNGVPSGNQMGGLADMIAWHYLDIPDEFERRRNHTIYSQAFNANYYTNNRNAYVDLPGVVWSVYVDQVNDTQLFVGPTAANDGSSQLSIDLGTALLGSPVSTTNVAINRNGVDGTYFAVRTQGDAFTTAPLTNGFTGAFPIGASPAYIMGVGIDPAELTTPGAKSGQIIVDNLDMTTQGGTGRGANDANDTVTVTLDLVAPGFASFSDTSIVLATSVDLGTLEPATGVPLPASITNLLNPAGLTGGIVVQIASATGDTSAIQLELMPTSLAANQTQPLTATLSGDGMVQAVYTISVHDDPGILGATTRPSLTLTIAANLSSGSVCVGDIADDFGTLTSDGQVSFGDFLALLGLIGPCAGGTPGCVGDIADDFGTLDSDGQVSFGDFLALLGLIGPCP